VYTVYTAMFIWIGLNAIHLTQITFVVKTASGSESDAHVAC